MRNCKQYAGIVLTMGMILALGCGESPVTPAADSSPSFAKGGGGRGGGGRGGGPGGDDEESPATVTVRDEASGDAVTNDGNFLYVDGAERVAVTITTGDFHFQTRTHRKGMRSLFASLGSPLLPGDVDPFDGQPQDLEGSDFRIHAGILDVACGETVSTHGRFLWGSGGQGAYHLAFGVPGILPAGLAGDLLTVSRDGNPDASTWTVTSDGTGYLRLDSVYRGTFLVPFQFTVTGEPGCP